MTDQADTGPIGEGTLSFWRNWLRLVSHPSRPVPINAGDFAGIIDAMGALTAELAAARDQIAAVTNERNRLAIIARQLMHGLTPKAEAERLIAAALSQSGQPTKETP